MSHWAFTQELTGWSTAHRTEDAGWRVQLFTLLTDRRLSPTSGPWWLVWDFLYDFTSLFSQRRRIRDYTTTLGSKALPGIGYVGCHLEIAWNMVIAHVMSNAYVDLWNMPNNFCFHVYAQKSLIISEIGNVYFLTSSTREFRVHRASSQLNIGQLYRIYGVSHLQSPDIQFVWRCKISIIF